MFSRGSHITGYRNETQMGKWMDLALQRGVLVPNKSKVISLFPPSTCIKPLTKNNLIEQLGTLSTDISDEILQLARV